MINYTSSDIFNIPNLSKDEKIEDILLEDIL